VLQQGVKASADIISRLSPKDVFKAKAGAGGFLEPHWIKVRLMEGERPFRGLRKSCMTK
jgi:hypothetical protein